MSNCDTLFCYSNYIYYLKMTVGMHHKKRIKVESKKTKQKQKTHNRIKTVFNYSHWQKAQKQLRTMKMPLNHWLSEMLNQSIKTQQNLNTEKGRALEAFLFFPP